ncbi:MAG: acetoacetate--CoA ligase [Candidatus Bathyarchaeota archaeon]|nr:MAG: acetoacetate--CoA ligase [Candidatus Bathyarchaeota archaeon]
MGKLLWQPSEELVRQANITKFIAFVNKRYDLRIASYHQLYKWSIEKTLDFWEAMWEFGDIKYSRGYDKVVDNFDKFPGARWFIGARLNFADNLLRHNDDHLGFIFRGETQKLSTMTYAEVYNSVARLAKSLRDIGIVSGDRVCAYMPNLIETAIAMLAATSIGAMWSSCGADLGAQAVLDRFSQIEPKVMFTADGCFYKSKTFNILRKAEQVVKGIPSLEKTIIFPYVETKPDIYRIPNSMLYHDFLSSKKKPNIRFEQLSFDHPIYIMFSSGTTGKPKCMVQGAGGVLINHLKELILHTDLKREDTIMYITSCSWMMWNWLLSSLAIGATIVLYDGNPNYPDLNAMWRLIHDHKITIFGCSASYINYLRSQRYKLRKDLDISSLREISQTGSSLSAAGFQYVYQDIKQNLHFNSISGGTDINGCFAIGSPTLPVHAGELQSPALGMKVNAYDEKGNPIVDQHGELICEAPFPSMPLYFWNDPDNERYKEAYFNYYPGHNVWRHGDYIMIHSDTGGITFFGRSDTVLKPSGVRIGTAEIYNVVEQLKEIAYSVAIVQKWKEDQRVILFVKLASGYDLTKNLKNSIRKTLRENASPRHVPALIIEVPDIPYTFNMKKVEIAITNIIHDRPVSNRDALRNPESLDYFERILPSLQNIVD